MGNDVCRNHLGLGESELLMNRTELFRFVIANRLNQQTRGIADCFGTDTFLDLLQAHAAVCHGGKMIVALWSHGRASLSLRTLHWDRVVRWFANRSAGRDPAMRVLMPTGRFFDTAVTIITDDRTSPSEDGATRPAATCNAVAYTVHPQIWGSSPFSSHCELSALECTQPATFRR